MGPILVMEGGTQGRGLKFPAPPNLQPPDKRLHFNSFPSHLISVEVKGLISMSMTFF